MVAAFALALSLTVLPAVPASSAEQALAEVVGPTGEVPRDSFKTWALFLVCNPEWVTPEKSGDLANLYRRFRGFGDAIGPDNLAVWFWTERTDMRDPLLTEKVDVARSAEYCRELQLRPTAGPFLVITSAYPALDGFPQDRAVFELGGLEPAELARLLNGLTDQLLLEGRVDEARLAAGGAPPAASTESASLWIRLLESARRSMVGFGCRLKVRIDTGVLSAELRECAGPG